MKSLPLLGRGIPGIPVKARALVSQTSPLLALYGIGQLLPGCLTRITHRHIHIFMGVITLRVMAHHNVTPWQMKPESHMIHITLMMMVVTTLNSDYATHDRRKEG
jgi:hypothetical protein